MVDVELAQLWAAQAILTSKLIAQQKVAAGEAHHRLTEARIMTQVHDARYAQTTVHDGERIVDAIANRLVEPVLKVEQVATAIEHPCATSAQQPNGTTTGPLLATDFLRNNPSKRPVE